MADTPASKTWRQLMTHAVRADRLRRGFPEPSRLPAEVRLYVFIDPPVELAPESEVVPIFTRSGDVDKYARNVLDALHDTRKGAAGLALLAREIVKGSFVIVDDHQVWKLKAEKHYAIDSVPPGIFIEVLETSENYLRDTAAEIRAHIRYVGVLPDAGN